MGNTQKKTFLSQLVGKDNRGQRMKSLSKDKFIFQILSVVGKDNRIRKVLFGIHPAIFNMMHLQKYVLTSNNFRE